MDYDSYHSSSSFGGHDPRDPRPHASSYPHDAQYQLPSHHRASRSSSTAPSDGNPPPTHQPLNNAIRNAFDQSNSARTVDPDLIAQIAAEVKKSVLDEIKLSGIAGATQPQTGTTSQQHVPPSPASTSASIPPRNVYTPPSPFHPDDTDQPYASHDPLARDPILDDHFDNTPTPRHERDAPIEATQERPPARPAPAVRMATDDFTPIEKMWQRLFDTDGQPLPRLGEFLRGLAMHLIEDYEPKKSLVISPAKMLKFYEDVRLQDEIYPWETIFGKLPYTTLSKIYRDMRCSHHLIQEHPATQPDIPALTPEGFQEWMTVMIQAYPDMEYERVSKTVLDMPISNADDPRERFPKELPRRLFPRKENIQAQQRCAANLSAEGVGPLRRAPTFPPPPPMSQSSTTAPNLERERSPYGSHSEPTDHSVEEELASSPVPLERQRKPYAAMPHGGKVHDDSTPSMQPDAQPGQQRKRAQSSAGQSPWTPTSSEGHYSQHHRADSQANARRTRTPSFSGYGTHSDPNVRDIPSSYYASNMHGSQQEPRRFSKDDDVKRHDHHRRGTTGTDSSYDPHPRSTYDDDYYKGRTGSCGYNDRGYDDRGYDFRRY